MADKLKDGDDEMQPGKSVVVPCSGASDVGEITDRAARRLHEEGKAELVCLAAILARVGWACKALAGATRVLAMDGCPEDCVSKALAQAGVENLHHIRVTDMDMVEGESPATPVRVQKVCDKAQEKLQD